MNFCLLRVMALGLCLAGASARAEEIDEVSLDDPKPSPQATSQPQPTLPAPPPEAQPTAVATSQPSPTAVPAPAPTPAATQPKPGLDQPGFDAKSSPAPASEDDEGLIIIAPGASSPEDSLEAFGIDSPFNWRFKGGRKNLSQPGGAGAEDADTAQDSIELNAPETSDFRGGKIDMESGGARVVSAENYDQVEKAGFVVTGSDAKFDLSVTGEKNQKMVFAKGSVFSAAAEPGRQVYPGSIYSIYRNYGKVFSGGAEKRELGVLIQAVGVAKVVRVDSEAILMRAEKSYDAARPGDLLRLRDPDRARHYASLRVGREAASSSLNGTVAAGQERRDTVRAGHYLYLDFGRSQGLVPGMRLAVYRDPVPARDSFKEIPGPSGKVGEIEVVSVQRSTATARVVKSVIGLAPGDRVRNR